MSDSKTTKEILINQTHRETRIAIMESGLLAELYVEKPENARIVGNIYKGVVENVLDGMQAAFVDIGFDTNSFLPYSEIEDNALVLDQGTEDDDDEDDDESDKGRDKGKSRDKGRKQSQRGRGGSRQRSNKPPMNLKTGQEILVQVIKEPYMGKGARVTTNVAIPGRFMVLVPNANYVGISRKVNNNFERRRLRKIAYKIKPKDFGVIIRTVAEGKDEEVLEGDMNNLLDGYKRMETAIKKQPAPTLVYKDMETVSSLIRDLFTPDVDHVIVDSKAMHRQLNGYLRGAAPQLVDRLELHRDKSPIFEKYAVEVEIQKTLTPRVQLRSGATIVIEQTEALVSIDVNSGRYVGRKDHEANAVKINLEAAREIARQLRLRDIGGLIVIDFIDMHYDENKKKVYYELRRELRKDRAKVAVNYISDFGLLEMTRQRIRLNLLLSATEECPVCHGSGRIPSKASMVTKIESWFRRYRTKAREFKLELQVHPELASFMRSGKKNVIRSMQWQHLMKIDLKEDDSLNIDEFKVYSRKHKKEITQEY
ncbi:MAG: Rne/Rng family ribonuclease [Candidatus Marinimicrobia bacterium]|nr:Rne/Rng family ribonuclease [Candidatus Neomarinimicrobiota bacterium]MCF7840656.1 Rne/Rng family ribonuclease [Candidatus Neomarinimicrobiota bacterium]